MDITKLENTIAELAGKGEGIRDRGLPEAIVNGKTKKKKQLHDKLRTPTFLLLSGTGDREKISLVEGEGVLPVLISSGAHFVS